MRSRYSVLRIACCVLIILSIIHSAAAQQQPIGRLIPIGGGYSEVYAGFAQEAVANAKNNQVKILVLPIAYATNPQLITDAERADNLKAVEERRVEIEEACKQAAPATVTCTVTLAPIFTRSDAVNPDSLNNFTDDLSAIFMLDGDQSIGMEAITGTPIEAALKKAYDSGVIVAGTGAGGSLQSAAMLVGYNQEFAAGNALNFRAANVWNTASKHGLSFSIKNAILDQYFYQRNHLGLLLNAIALPDVPHIGVGIDAATGVNVYDGARLQDVFGLYTVTILDAETYHAADAVQYRGPTYTLSLRNVLVHTLAPGNFSYDLSTGVVAFQSKIQTPKPKLDRSFEALTLPKTAGPLILAGDLSESLDGNPILARFAELAGGSKAQILIVATGYPTDSSAQIAAEKYATALGVPSQTIVVPVKDTTEPLVMPDDFTAILLIARDQSKAKVQSLAPIKAAWLSGKPLLADNAGAAIAGKFYSGHGPTPKEADGAELATQKSFVQGTTTISNGLNLLDVMIEPQVLNDNRWGRLFSLAYNHPDRIAFGLTHNTAVEITHDGAQAIGDNVLFALDLRTAKLATGTNDAFVIANGLLDVFAGGDEVKPSLADVKAQPTRVPTPEPPTSTPTPTTTPTRTPEPTLTPTPTFAPLPTSTPTPGPTAAPAPLPPSGPSGPIVPIAIGLSGLILLIVLLAARRPRGNAK